MITFFLELLDVASDLLFGTLDALFLEVEDDEHVSAGGLDAVGGRASSSELFVLVDG